METFLVVFLRTIGVVVGVDTTETAVVVEEFSVIVGVCIVDVVVLCTVVCVEVLKKFVQFHDNGFHHAAKVTEGVKAVKSKISVKTFVVLFIKIFY